MSVNKVEMSLDDIIKANKGKAKTNKRGGVSQKATGSQKTPKRVVNPANRISKFQQKGADKRVQNFKKNANNTRGRLQNLNTVATQKLVQKLVKKALAQSNVSRIVRGKPIGKPAIRRRGAVRYVKQPVVLSRVSPRSRVISRNQRFPNGRSVVRLASNQQFLPTVSRVKYVAAVRPIIKRQQQQRITYVRQPKRKQVQIVTRQQIRRPAFIQKQRPIIVQQQSPVGFRRNGAGGSRVGTSVRDQIAALRQQQQVVYVQRPKPQVTYVQREVQPRRQSRGRNARFQGQRKPQQQRRPNRNNDPFYEPPNYLQRF